MKKALLVVDVQEDFIGELRNKNKFSYENTNELINNINHKIEIYSKNINEVIYIANVLPRNFFYKKFFPYGLVGSEGAKLDKRLKIVSENYFEKQVGNAFKNNNLVKFIKEKGINEVEIVGVDGTGCVFRTAKGALEIGLKVSILKDSVGTINRKKLINVIKKLESIGVMFIE